MLGMPVGPRPKAVATAQPTAQPVYAAQTQQAVPARTEPAIQGTIVPGESLADKLAWLQRSADSHNTYILEVTADESISPYVFNYQGAINLTIVLRGVGGNRTIRLKSHGNMFTVKQNVTFILDNNITLYGHDGNTKCVVYVESGVFKMNAGSTITGNGNCGVSNGSTFTMSGGTISNNSNKGVYNSGTFTMTGGAISGNNSSNGGGVFIYAGTFTMSGGTISGNNAKEKGGGVYVSNDGIASNGTFIMRGGIITGNTAINYGGGVYFNYNGRGRGSFKKTGGTITGYNSDQTNGNVVKDESGNVFARKGHTVYVGNGLLRKETTAGTEMNLSCKKSEIGMRIQTSGAWDQ